MLDAALANNSGRLRVPWAVDFPTVARVAARAAVVALIVACAVSQATNLPAVLQRVGTPYPILITDKVAIAAIGIHTDGRLTVFLAPILATVSDREMLAFLYLHELGHGRLGHLRPEDPRHIRFAIPGLYKGLAWQMEYDADAWAAMHAPTWGYDPVRGVEAVFIKYGDGGGLTHPPDAIRISRVKRLATEIR